MNTKEYILTKLVETHDRYISGELLATELGVTRAAVWKAMRELASDRIEIDALRNQGYRLTDAARVRGMNLLLGAERVSGYLKNKLPVKVWRTLDSTNNTARELATEQSDKKRCADRRGGTDGRQRSDGAQLLLPRGLRTICDAVSPPRMRRDRIGEADLCRRGRGGARDRLVAR